MSFYANVDDYDNARVSGNAGVYGNAQVYENARVSGNARVSKKIITINGACQFGITICNTTIQIGCHCHTIDEWEKIRQANRCKSECKNEYEYQKCIRAYEAAKSLIEEKEA